VTVTNVPMWIVFGVVVFSFLALDLGVFHRRDHVIGLREALLWSLLWFGLAMTFNLGVYLQEGRESALKFLIRARLVSKRAVRSAPRTRWKQRPASSSSVEGAKGMNSVLTRALFSQSFTLGSVGW